MYSWLLFFKKTSLKSLSPQVLNEKYPVRLPRANSISYYISVKVLALIQNTKTSYMKTTKSKLFFLPLSRNWDGFFCKTRIVCASLWT